MSRILVTGVAGFVGSHTADLLLAEGHEVLGVDNFRTGRWSNLRHALDQRGFTLVEADVAEAGTLGRLVCEFRPTAVIHLAALVGVPESFANPLENYRLNVHATRLLATAAARCGVRRLVYASSAAVYGEQFAFPVTEDAPCAPQSPYAEAKLDSETLLLAAVEAHGFTVRCHRYFNVYGPRQRADSPYSGVISRFAAALSAGEPPEIHGDGAQTRDFIAVEDVARANVLAATRPGIASGVANICTGRAVSLNELYAMMCRLTLRPHFAAHHGPARPGDIRHSVGSPERARRDLGFLAAIPLEAGLAAAQPSEAAAATGAALPAASSW